MTEARRCGDALTLWIPPMLYGLSRRAERSDSETQGRLKAYRSPKEDRR